MSIAYTANHVYDPSPLIAETYSRHVEEIRNPLSEMLKRHWKAIELAISDRLQGTVHLEGDEMSVGYYVVRADR
jgi:hypothetical protein